MTATPPFCLAREADLAANLNSISRKTTQRKGCSYLNALHGQRCSTAVPDV